jgi:hypothetical protein
VTSNVKTGIRPVFARIGNLNGTSKLPSRSRSPTVHRPVCRESAEWIDKLGDAGKRVLPAVKTEAHDVEWGVLVAGEHTLRVGNARRGDSGHADTSAPASARFLCIKLPPENLATASDIVTREQRVTQHPQADMESELCDYLCRNVHATPSDDADLAVIVRAPKGTEVHPRTVGANGAHGSERVVEHALALALERASAAGRWDVVARLASELQARREARVGVRASSETRARGQRSAGSGLRCSTPRTTLDPRE